MKNRIIKFRAWLSVSKKMFYVRKIQFEKDKFTNDGYVWLDNSQNQSDDGQVDLSLVKLSQYTGLKDKNGKEIYEGDIVKDKDGLLFVVGWGEDTAQFSTYPLDKDNDDHRERFNGEQSDDFEIIGNIYENKNLIK